MMSEKDQQHYEEFFLIYGIHCEEDCCTPSVRPSFPFTVSAYTQLNSTQLRVLYAYRNANSCTQDHVRPRAGPPPAIKQEK